MAKPLPRSWFKEEAVALAPRLLGKTLRHKHCAGTIVEVEAYMGDPASHARTLTPRSRLMHETYGHWYVYFTYGMHYCVNVTAGEGPGGILIRAIEPTEGIPLMRRRRGVSDLKNLANGPAKLTQALGITKKMNGLLLGGEFVIEDAPELPASAIMSGPRIGIRNGIELPWRFWIKDNPFVSR
ncbi:MAG: DNA-3-methyladenine glycosylase [Bacillota bacterium]